MQEHIDEKKIRDVIYLISKDYTQSGFLDNIWDKEEFVKELAKSIITALKGEK